MKRAAWIVGAAALVAGCGQKGALYLPDKSAQVITTPAASPAQAPSPETVPAPPASAPATPPKPTDENDDSQTPK